MEHLRMFKVSYLGATNTRPSRVRIIDTRHKKTVIMSYDHQFNNTKDIALDYLKKRNIDIISFSSDDDNYYLHTDDFETQIK